MMFGQHRLYGLICCAGAAALVGFLAQGALAMPASPHPFEAVQPDGTPITLFIRGDEYFHWLEDADGYTVVEQDGLYTYAALDAQGQLVPTALEVGRIDPQAEGLGQHTLPLPATLKQMRSRALLPPKGGAPPGLAPPSTGTVKNVVILMRFSNHGGRTLPTPGNMGVLFNAVGGDPVLAPTGSVRDVYLENSYGTLTIDSTIFGWVDLPNTEQYYADGTSGGKTDEAITAALNLLDPLINFSNFDVDTDLWVDAIAFIHSGFGAEWGGFDEDGTAEADRIWSHKGSIATWTSAEGVRVSPYHISPGLWDTSGSDIGRIGVISHESGHFWGLPDLYDTNGGGEGLGSWGMMGNSWGFDGSQLHPPHFCAWSKISFGWVTPTVIGPGTYTAPQSEFTPTVYRIDNGYPADEYLLIENREPVGVEDDMPQGGLVVWHIDDAKSGWNTDEGSPGQAGWPGNGNHYRVAVLQADDWWDLETGFNRGDSGDPYHADGVCYLAPSPITSPNTDTYQGGVVNPTGNRISVNDPAGANVEFTFTTSGFAPTAVCQAFSDAADANCCITVDVDDIDNGSFDPNGDCFTLCITEVDGNWVGCEETVQVCGEGNHAVTLEISDPAGASQSCDAAVTVVDGTKPVITQFPADQNLQCNAEAPAPDTSLVTATDNCDANVAITWQGDSSNGGAGCSGDPLIIQRTYRATDNAGNFVEQIQTFTIVDTISPTITCAITNAVQPIEVDANCQAPVEFSVTVTDNCCVDPNDVAISASVTTNNATLGAIVLDPLPPVGPSVTITGQVMVSDLTCCPATVLVVASAVDCCGQATPLCTDDVDVIDNYPPAGACGLTHDHDGWNWVDNTIELTANEPTYWSVLSGLPKATSPFGILDPGWLPGRPDPDSDQSGDRVMRGYVVAWAVNELGEEIRWNHLKGEALLINYLDGSAWEYNAYAFQALIGANGAPTGTPGQLNLNGTEYDNCFGQLLLDFYAVGSTALSGGGRLAAVDTDLTLLAVGADLRQNTSGPVTTKANFDIWNMNEWHFSGTERCITCWDQTLLGNYDAPNYFLLSNLQTDKGKARIDGLASALCPDSVPAPLLGVTMNRLSFDAGADLAMAGTNLVGLGTLSALIQYDTGSEPPPERPVSPLEASPGETPGQMPLSEAAPARAVIHRAGATTKGSLLIFPKVELRWDWCGNVIQDTFLDLSNDYPGSVQVKMYFVNGDPPADAQLPRCIGQP